MVAQAYRVRPMPISKPQQQFRQLTCWLRGLCSGRGGGKTRIGAVSILRTGKNGDSWMVVSPDNNMIRETTLPMFIEVGNFTEQLIKTVTSPTPRAWFRTLDGGTAEVVFKGAEVPDKLRGSNRSGIWFDEASIISEEAFQLGIATCRRNGVMGPCFATFTPRGFKHWTFERFYSRLADHEISKHGDSVKWFQGRPYVAIPNTALVHSRTRDNPFLPQEFEATIGGNYSSILGMQELGGEFVEISGLIFKRHWFKLVDDVPIDCARVRVWDKAGSESGCYTVGCLMARDKKGLFYIEDIVRGQWSYYDRNNIIYETARRDFLKYGGTVTTYIEQEGGGDGKAVMDQLLVMLAEFPVYRLMPRGGQQWKHKANLRLPGDAKIQRALPFAAQCEAGNVCILNAAFTSDCLEELSAFPEYAFADQVDACFPAGTAVATANGDKKIEEVNVNDLVLTRNGYRKVKWSKKTGNTTGLIEIRCNDRVIRCTPNHPIYIEGQGWVQAQSVVIGQSVLALTASCLKGQGSCDTQTAIESICGGITGAGEATGGIYPFIAQCGKVSTAKSRQSTSFITSMATPLIMPLAIWSACQRGSTRNCTLSRARLLLGRMLGLKRSAARLASGTSLPLVASGIDCTPNRLLKAAILFRRFARDAIAGLRRRFTTRSSAHGSAAPIGQPQQKFAHSARKSLHALSERSIAASVVVDVVTLRLSEPLPVFNLSVDVDEEYFANGVLVHNCSYAHGKLAMTVPDHLYADRTVQEIDVSPSYGNSVRLEDMSRKMPSDLFKN